MDDPLFGTFTFDPQLGFYVGVATWAGLVISLALTEADPLYGRLALNTAYVLWENQAAWDRRVRDTAVRELLPLKNREWLDLDEAELTADQFLARMTLEAIDVDRDGSFVFWFNADELFCGQIIQISGSLAEGITDARILPDPAEETDAI